MSAVTKHMEKIILPNQFLLEQVLENLEKGKWMSIPVKGGSMRPFLRAGDRVLLKPFEKGSLKLGMIILGRIDGNLILHRLVRYDRERVWLAGDDNLVQHEILPYGDVLATAVRLYRGEKILELNERWRCNLGQFWYRIRLLRRIIRKLKYSAK